MKTTLPIAFLFLGACQSAGGTAAADETRLTLDRDGNLLVPVYWQGILVKDGDHRLSRPEDIERLKTAVAEF